MNEEERGEAIERAYMLVQKAVKSAVGANNAIIKLLKEATEDHAELTPMQTLQLTKLLLSSDKIEKFLAETKALDNLEQLEAEIAGKARELKKC